jgi:hypothetical protein
MNNKVKVIAHQAYAFRKPKTYITAIYHCCADLPLPRTLSGEELHMD